MTGGAVLRGVWAIVCLLLAGEAWGAGEIHNVFHSGGTASFKRVALLPMTFPAVCAEESWSREKLEPLLKEKLTQAGRFEVMTVTADQLRRWTGKNGWRSEERLPVDLLPRLQAETGCDGIMFVHLNGLSAYPPLAIGWRMRLVNAKEGQTVWAVEAAFGASISKPEYPLKDVWFLRQKESADWKRTNSPEALVRNSLERIFSALPQEGNIPAKVSAPSADTSDRVGANQRKPRLPAKETKYGNKTEPTPGAAHAGVRSGSGQGLPPAGD